MSTCKVNELFEMCFERLTLISEALINCFVHFICFEIKDMISQNGKNTHSTQFFLKFRLILVLRMLIYQDMHKFAIKNG